MHVEVGTVVFAALVLIATFGILAKWLKMPYPIVFVIGGALLAFIPGLPRIEVKPDIVFLLFLPPLLYGGGFQTEWRSFKTYIRPIMLLAIGLVIATTAAVAFVAHVFFAMPLAVAFVLGAIVSPPDAVATEAIAQDLTLPRPIKTILSGESLINDASALVIYAFAVAAVTTGTFSLGGAVLQFFYVSIVGVAIGALSFQLIAMLLRFVRAHNLADDTISVLFSLIVPYIVYIVADTVHASGVLAAVTAGILTGRRISEVFDAESRIAASGVWNLLTFGFNGVLFLLIGIELRFLLADLHLYPLGTLLAFAAAISAVVIIVRFAWVWLITAFRKRILPSMAPGSQTGPTWRGKFVISWAGMRGIVTLAAALSVPTLGANGEPFPFRDLIILIAFAVIVVTLVGQGLTLPILIRAWDVTSDEDPARAQAEARILAAEAGLAFLKKSEIEFQTATHWDVAGRIRSYYESRLDHDRADIASDDPTADGTAHTLYREMRRGAYEAERAALVRLRRSGEITDEAYRELEWDLDLAVARLN